MMEALAYQPSLKGHWDSVLDRSRNGLFLFRREFMEYHSDRFQDLSYVFLHDGKPVGLVVGHLDGPDGWATHRGLTHGGIVALSETRTPDLQSMFDALHNALRQRNISRVRYKPLPWWLQTSPAQEDLWILDRLGAKREALWLNTLVDLQGSQKVSSLRKRGAAKARQTGIVFCEGDLWEKFWPVLEHRLTSRHGVKPVHTLDEIRLLAGRFPDKIRLWCATDGDEVLAGIVGFLFDTTFHVQYSAASDRGRDAGALDLLALSLIEQNPSIAKWLSFGTSCEQGGQILNEGLLAWKEGFGGHGAVYDDVSYDLPDPAA
jgi:hypothetical protein